MKLELNATPEEVMRAVAALRDFGLQHGMGEKELFSLALALEECGSNIVNHALRRDARQVFQVILERTTHGVTIELRDRGPEFDPTKRTVGKPDPGAEGGWGLQLIRQNLDEIGYVREDGENVLRLIKRFNPTAGRM